MIFSTKKIHLVTKACVSITLAWSFSISSQNTHISHELSLKQCLNTLNTKDCMLRTMQCLNAAVFTCATLASNNAHVNTANMSPVDFKSNPFAKATKKHRVMMRLTTDITRLIDSCLTLAANKPLSYKIPWAAVDSYRLLRNGLELFSKTEDDALFDISSQQSKLLNALCLLEALTMYAPAAFDATNHRANIATQSSQSLIRLLQEASLNRANTELTSGILLAATANLGALIYHLAATEEIQAPIQPTPAPADEPVPAPTQEPILFPNQPVDDNPNPIETPVDLPIQNIIINQPDVQEEQPAPIIDVDPAHDNQIHDIIDFLPPLIPVDEPERNLHEDIVHVTIDPEVPNNDHIAPPALPEAEEPEEHIEIVRPGPVVLNDHQRQARIKRRTLEQTLVDELAKCRSLRDGAPGRAQHIREIIRLLEEVRRQVN